MAVGIACAGSGLPEAVGLLEPLLQDGQDFVRQGALMALGLVLQQETSAHLPRVTAVRERLTKIISEKKESTLSKMGAIYSLGIIDAGGRNSAVSIMCVWREVGEGTTRALAPRAPTDDTNLALSKTASGPLPTKTALIAILMGAPGGRRAGPRAPSARHPPLTDYPTHSPAAPARASSARRRSSD